MRSEQRLQGRCEVPAVRRGCQGTGIGSLPREIHLKDFRTERAANPSHRRQRSGNPVSNPAESYESYMVPALFAPWASQLVQRANPQPGERVLDLACRNGRGRPLGCSAARLQMGGDGDRPKSNHVICRSSRCRRRRSGHRMATGAGRAAALRRLQFRPRALLVCPDVLCRPRHSPSPKLTGS